MLDAFAQAGVRPILTVNYGNALYDGGEAPHTDAGRAAFCRYFVAAVERFAGRGIVWEVWNVRCASRRLRAPAYVPE